MIIIIVIVIIIIINKTDVTAYCWNTPRFLAYHECLLVDPGDDVDKDLG